MIPIVHIYLKGQGSDCAAKIKASSAGDHWIPQEPPFGFQEDNPHKGDKPRRNWRSRKPGSKGCSRASSGEKRHMCRILPNPVACGLTPILRRQRIVSEAPKKTALNWAPETWSDLKWRGLRRMGRGTTRSRSSWDSAAFSEGWLLRE
jgi:hypothetical protein